MSKANLYKFGPFTGGLNNASDPLQLREQELQDLINLEVEPGGALRVRPRIREYDFSSILGSLPATTHLQYIGKGFVLGKDYAFFSWAAGSTTNGIYAWDTSAKVILLIAAGMRASSAQQFGEMVYFVPTPNSATGGGRWDGTTFTGSSNTPTGADAVFYKNRFWIFREAESELRFTDVITPGTVNLDTLWNALNLIKVNSGDGQKATGIRLYKDTLLLFRESSTWVFSYSIDPSTGTLSVVNSDIGASSKWAIAFYNNSYFVINNRLLYYMSNYNFTLFGPSINFTLGTAGTAIESVSVFKNYLTVTVNDRFYAYNFVTATWSRWQNATNAYAGAGLDLRLGAIGQTARGVPVAASVASDPNGVLPLASFYEIDYVYSTEQDTVTTWNAGAFFNAPTSMNIPFSFTTKIVDYQFPVEYKRLMWVGVDAELLGTTTLTITDQRAVATTSSVIVDNVTSFFRKMLKFPARLRFRQVTYTVSGASSGNFGANNRSKVYSITTSVGVKELVTGQVN